MKTLLMVLAYAAIGFFLFLVSLFAIRLTSLASMPVFYFTYLRWTAGIVWCLAGTVTLLSFRNRHINVILLFGGIMIICGVFTAICYSVILQDMPTRFLATLACYLVVMIMAGLSPLAMAAAQDMIYPSIRKVNMT